MSYLKYSLQIIIVAVGLNLPLFAQSFTLGARAILPDLISNPRLPSENFNRQLFLAKFKSGIGNALELSYYRARASITQSVIFNSGNTISFTQDYKANSFNVAYMRYSPAEKWNTISYYFGGGLGVGTVATEDGADNPSVSTGRLSVLTGAIYGVVGVEYALPSASLEFSMELRPGIHYYNFVSILSTGSRVGSPFALLPNIGVSYRFGKGL